MALPKDKNFFCKTSKYKQVFKPLKEYYKFLIKIPTIELP